MLTTEKYDNQGKSGEYSVIVASRFVIAADGSGVAMDALKAAVAAVGPGPARGACPRLKFAVRITTARQLA